MDVRLDGKNVLITGASSGIGAVMARAYAAAGAQVALVGRDRARVDGVRADIEAAGGTARSFVADLQTEDAGERLVESVVAGFGALDVVVHAAGVFEVVPFADDVTQLERQWATNVGAGYRLVHAALPHLADGASVLLLSSIAGRVGFAGASGYCATKGAVENLVRALALELGPRGVRVNAIAPGNVRSPMNAALFEDPQYEEAMLERTPLGRIGVPEDIAPMAVFLASEHASYVTGASMVIDGGWTAH